MNVSLRFRQPVRGITLDGWRRVAVLASGSRCCRIRWTGSDYSTALWRFMALQVPMPFDHRQRIAGVTPGARIMLRAEGEQQGRAALETIGAIGAAGIEPGDAAAAHWRTVGNRLAARQTLLAYTVERHVAHLAREAMC